MIIKLKQKRLPKYQDALLLSYAKVLLPISLALVFLFYFLLDRPIALYLHEYASFLKKIGAATSDILSPLVIICAGPVLFFLNKILWRKKKIHEISHLLLFSAPLSYVAVKTIKSIVERARPKTFFSQGLYGFHTHGESMKDSSFPSGHACALGALAGTLSCFYPKYTWYFMGSALFFSLARVVKLDHFFSDILIGTVIGGFISQLVHIYMKKNISLGRYHEP